MGLKGESRQIFIFVLKCHNIYNNISSILDTLKVIQALSKKETRQYLNNDSNRSYQKQSNRAFNRSTYEFARGT